MKQLLLVTLLTALSMLPSALRAQSQLVVEQKDGTRTAFVLTDLPVITFAEENLCITSATAEVQMARTKVAKCYFEAVPTNIQQLGAAQRVCFDLRDNNLLVMKGVTGTVGIYDTAGHCHYTTQAKGEEVISIELSNLPIGTYLVKTLDYPTVKIFKK